MALFEEYTNTSEISLTGNSVLGEFYLPKDKERIPFDKIELADDFVYGNYEIVPFNVLLNPESTYETDDQQDIGGMARTAQTTGTGSNQFLSTIELHVFDYDGNYIDSKLNDNFGIVNSTDGNVINVNIETDLRDIGLDIGTFRFVYNFHHNILGTSEDQNFEIETISADRREVSIKALDDLGADELRTFMQLHRAQSTNPLNQRPYKKEYLLNFGENKLLPVTNVTFAENDYFPRINESVVDYRQFELVTTTTQQNQLGELTEIWRIPFIGQNITPPRLDVENLKRVKVKLYAQLPDEFEVGTRVSLVKQFLKPYIDKITIFDELLGPETEYLLGPNFAIETGQIDSFGTSLQSWNDLVGTGSTDTQRRILNRYFSSSLEGIAELNVEYCRFDEFIHFSSAVQRIENFRNKLTLIDYYNSQLETRYLGPGDTISTQDIVTFTALKNDVISNFDGFEHWLYYETGSQDLYTFATSCSYDPWPKKNLTLWVPAVWGTTTLTFGLASGSWGNFHTASGVEHRYEPTPVTHPQSVSYYQNLYTLAEDYDLYNESQLTRTVPLSMRNDPANSEYIKYVNMIAHQFDVNWLYIKHMTKINEREEHPKDGLSNDLVYGVAHSLGMHLYHGNQDNTLSDLEFGLSGFADTLFALQSGSLSTKSAKERTREIWRRLLNNLPYLYKTCGTRESIKAILACYGIPETILKIREYGGPEFTTGDYIIDEREEFLYKLQNDSTTGAGITSWWNTINDGLGNTEVPDTIQLRFELNPVSSSTATDYPILQMGAGQQPAFYVNAAFGGGTSGSLKFYLSGSSGYKSASVQCAKLWDNTPQWLSIQRGTTTSSIDTANTYTLYLYKNRKDNITYSSSAVISTTAAETSYNAQWTGSNFLYTFQGWNPEVPSPISTLGSIYDLRYYMTRISDTIQRRHTLAPEAYFTDNPTGSFYDLKFRYRPDGYDKRNMTDPYKVISIHPDQTITTFVDGLILSSSLAGYTDDDVKGIVETHYVPVPSVLCENQTTEKIRIESSSVRRGNLSPTHLAAEHQFDLAPNDSERVGIYFSPTDVINEDIVNHTGEFRIDDFLANESSTEEGYPELNWLREEYFKKYPNRNSLKDYINFIANYDLSVFKTIKDCLPARVKATMGILVEPNILERPKMRLTRKQSYERLDHSTTIQIGPVDADITATYDTYTGTIPYIFSGVISGSTNAISTGQQFGNIVATNFNGATYQLNGLRYSSGSPDTGYGAGWITSSNSSWERNAIQTAPADSRLSVSTYGVAWTDFLSTSGSFDTIPTGTIANESGIQTTTLLTSRWNFAFSASAGGGYIIENLQQAAGDNRLAISSSTAQTVFVTIPLPPYTEPLLAHVSFNYSSSIAAGLGSSRFNIYFGDQNVASAVPIMDLNSANQRTRTILTSSIIDQTSGSKLVLETIIANTAEQFFIDDLKITLRRRSRVQEYISRGLNNHRWAGCQISSDSVGADSTDTPDNSPVVERFTADPNVLLYNNPSRNLGSVSGIDVLQPR